MHNFDIEFELRHLEQTNKSNENDLMLLYASSHKKDVSKSFKKVMENIKDNIDITDIIKPVYNFKAGEE